MAKMEWVTFEIAVREGAERWLLTSDVAPLLGVSPKTIARWAREGKLPCQATLGGHHRFNEREMQDLVRSLINRPTQGNPYA